jgi:hypothetical protein
MDVCDPGAGATTTVAVTTDEPTASAPGAGGQDHCPDAQVANGHISLRSERSGPAGHDNGRVYGLTATARDASGNVGTLRVAGGCPGCPGAVCVPHDQNPKSPGQTPGNSPTGVCNAIDDGQIYNASVCQ